MLITTPSNLLQCCQHANAPYPKQARVHSHETYNGAHFDNGKDKFGLTKAFDTAQIDAHDDRQEEGDEQGLIYRVVPV